ncbi:MAG: KamA family radical SAM protein [Nanoarchaeota archaeon]
MKYHESRQEPWKLFGVTQQKWSSPLWQLRNSIKDVDGLSRIISLTENQKNGIGEAIKRGKPMRIPPYYAALMGENPTNVDSQGNSIGDTVNAIFLQSVPTPAHFLFPAGAKDPMSEGSRSIGAVYQRYPDRVALMSSSSAICAMFCTHCQRGRDMDGPIENNNLDIGLEYILQNENIREVLVTGGDALAISPEKLNKILSAISKAGHVESVRIASRLFVTNPYAITNEKLDIIASHSRLAKLSNPNIYVVTHANAPEELTYDMQDAVRRTKVHGLNIRNQTVLLKGINDTYERMSHLLRNLAYMGVDPYYVFICHKNDGLAASIVPINVGQYLIADQRGQQGISIPKLAVNMVGGGGKVDLTPQGDKGIPEFDYVISRPMRTWDNDERDYEELMRVNNSSYETGLRVMAEFYGDLNISRFGVEHIGMDLRTRETPSGKFHPSFIVVEDQNPSRVLYVTNVVAPTLKTLDNKCIVWGMTPNGARFGVPDQYISNPADVVLPTEKRA